MYTLKNYKTKKELKREVKEGKKVGVYQPGPSGGDPSEINGTVALEGPHYPKAHSWYA